MFRPQLSLPLLATAGAAALAVGCGGSSSGAADADPAAVVPANAPLYVEAALKPDGETSDEIKALGKKLAGIDDPGAELIRQFEREVNEDGGPKFSWKEDVEPWVGDRVGFFLSSFDAQDGEGEGALVAATSDADKAKKTLEKALAEKEEGDPAPKVEERKQGDVTYKVDTVGDNAVAIVDDYAVVGTEGGVKAAIDAAAGEGLEEADAFAKARDQVEDEAVGFAFIRFEQLLAAAGPQGAALKPFLGQFGESMVVALDTEDDAIQVETAQLGVKGNGAAGAGDPGAVLPTLPGDAWAAIGVKDVGAQFEQGLQQVGQLGAFGGFDLDEVLGQIEQAFGLDVRRDLISWMGDAGVFAQGTDLSNIGGALVVQSKDPAKTKAVIPKLEKFVRSATTGQARVRALDAPGVDAGFTVRADEVPLPIHVAAAGDKFVVALTDNALQAALKPSGTLADSPAYKDAASKLDDGIKPAAFVNVAPVASLIEGVGAGSDPDVAKVLDVLKKLSTIAAGSQKEGDIVRGRAVVGVK
jgi:hypothetical protein